MPVLYATHPDFHRHDTGPGHPERPARLDAVEAGIRAAGLDEAILRFEPRAADRAELERVHPGPRLDALERFIRSGGGAIDLDTMTGEISYDAALHAAGAGLESIERLDAGEADAAFCAVRPPGHHATPERAMGFCLVNNVAVAAAALADRGERVLIVDYDAHHGNGTQDAFYDDGRVAYVSLHQHPFYPGTGAIDEVGQHEGRGTVLNIPLPPGATGDVYRRGVDEVVAPFAELWRPTWVIVSAGFDAHRRDPLADLALTAADFADLNRDIIRLVPAGRRLLFLEGGYDLQGLADSVGAVLASLVDEPYRPEHPTSGGPGGAVIDRVVDLRRRLADEGAAGS